MLHLTSSILDAPVRWGDKGDAKASLHRPSVAERQKTLAQRVARFYRWAALAAEARTFGYVRGAANAAQQQNRCNQMQHN